METVLELCCQWKPTSNYNLCKFSSLSSPRSYYVRCCTQSQGGHTKKKPPSFKKSQEIFNDGKEIMPGGVSSPVRAFTLVDGDPVVMRAGKGSKVWDEDGNEYIDYVGSYGVSILGHAHDEVNASLNDTLQYGTTFGAPCRLENQLAKMVISAVPSVEMIRFVNSGTEACMSVIRLARFFTGREKIIKFDGCYHGHADIFVSKAGSRQETLTCPYNDIPAFQELFRTYKGEIAAVIVEPVAGNAGFITPKDGFLEELQAITYKNDSLLIFDEVMTGFRVSYGGAQGYFGITPDLTTVGKIMGGGLPVGAYGGRREIMELVAPAGPMYQAGTFSGNPVTMSAGIRILELLQEEGRYEYLDQITSKFVNGLLEVGTKAGHDICGGHIGGMFGFFFTRGPVYNHEDAKRSNIAKFAKFHRRMLEKGVYLAPSPYEAGFTSVAHSFDDIERSIEIAKEVFRQI